MQSHIDLYNKLKVHELEYGSPKPLPKYISDAQFGYARVKYFVDADYGLKLIDDIKNKYDLYFTYLTLMATAPLDELHAIWRNDHDFGMPTYLTALKSIINKKEKDTSNAN